MSLAISVNGVSYNDLTAAFPANAPITAGVYYGLARATPQPLGCLNTVRYSQVAFPGTFDGVGTVELGYEVNIVEVSFAIVGTLAQCATSIAALNAVLVRSDAARYTVTIQGYPSFLGCKLASHRFFEDIPLAGGKVLIHLHCVFHKLSDAN